MSVINRLNARIFKHGAFMFDEEDEAVMRDAIAALVAAKALADAVEAVFDNANIDTAYIEFSAIKHTLAAFRAAGG